MDILLIAVAVAWLAWSYLIQKSQRMNIEALKHAGQVMESMHKQLAGHSEEISSIVDKVTVLKERVGRIQREDHRRR